MKLQEIAMFERRELRSNLALSPANPSAPSPFPLGQQGFPGSMKSQDLVRGGSKSQNEIRWRNKQKRKKVYLMARSKTEFPSYKDSETETKIKSPVSEMRNLVLNLNTETDDFDRSNGEDLGVNSNLKSETGKNKDSFFREKERTPGNNIYSNLENELLEEKHFSSFSREGSGRKFVEGRRKRLKSHSLMGDVRKVKGRIISHREMQSRKTSNSQAKER